MFYDEPLNNAPNFALPLAESQFLIMSPLSQLRPILPDATQLVADVSQLRRNCIALANRLDKRAFAQDENYLQRVQTKMRAKNINFKKNNHQVLDFLLRRMRRSWDATLRTAAHKGE